MTVASVTIVGIHTPAQGSTIAELQAVWNYADRLGYGWISTSDHFPGSLRPTSPDPVVGQTLMAASTSRATVGVLVYSVGFRHPAVLANAASTIDHLSGGRAAIGLGAGAVAKDYEMYGFAHWHSPRHRMDMLEEGIQCVSRLLHDDVVDFEGEHFRLSGASLRPRPVQPHLPVWVGAKGEQRGLRIVAMYADGWNIGLVPVTEFARKRTLLERYCEEAGRSISDLPCSINLLLAVDTDIDSLPPDLRRAALTGSSAAIAGTLEEYAAAGADQINLHLPHPWPYDLLEQLASALDLPAVD